jgi:hypothetical protein
MEIQKNLASSLPTQVTSLDTVLSMRSIIDLISTASSQTVRHASNRKPLRFDTNDRFFGQVRFRLGKKMLSFKILLKYYGNFCRNRQRKHRFHNWHNKGKLFSLNAMPSSREGHNKIIY